MAQLGQPLEVTWLDVLPDGQLELLLPGEVIRQRDIDALLQSPQRSAIQIPWSVGGGQDQHLAGIIAGLLQAIHLSEELVLHQAVGFMRGIASFREQSICFIQEDD